MFPGDLNTILVLITSLQVKPLTEEEKKQKLAELRSKLADKRAAKAVQDAQDNKANEAIRRKAGKVRNYLTSNCFCILVLTCDVP